jgi:hypothetical protein
MAESGRAESGRVSGIARTSWLSRRFHVRPESTRRVLVVLLPGFASVSALVADSKIVVVIATFCSFLGVILVIVELLLEKRRDDMFASTVKEGRGKAELLRSITIHEAVRSKQLSSGDIVKLLRPSEPEKTSG